MGRDISGTTFLLGPNLVSFNRTLVAYEISKVNFRAEKKFLSVCQKRFNKLRNINISPGNSVVSDVPERVRDLGSPLRFMLRRSSLVECVSVLQKSVNNVTNFFYPSLSVCAAMFVKKS